MPIYGFKVIYKERVYHCISVITEMGIDVNISDQWIKPKFLEVTVINEDGELRIIRDEAWMFQFVPKVEGR